MTEAEKKSKLTPHPLVAAIVDERRGAADTVQVVGYIGESPRPQHVRVYLSLAFDEYLDVPEPAIVQHVDVPETEIAHGGTRLWIDGSAPVLHEVRQSTRTEARFLEGTIAAGYLGDAPAEVATAGAGRAVAAVSRMLPCHTMVGPLCVRPTVIGTRCPPCGASLAVLCPSALRPCASGRFTCVPWQCDITRRLCPRSIGPLCQASRICPVSRVCGFPEVGPIEELAPMAEHVPPWPYPDPWGRY